SFLIPPNHQVSPEQDPGTSSGHQVAISLPGAGGRHFNFTYLLTYRPWFNSNFDPEWGADRAKQALGGDFASFTAVGTTLDSGRPVLVATRDHREGSAQRADPKFLQTTTAAMMTVCRYASAVAIFLVVSLTPRSCADISEPAMAAEEPVKSVVNETVHQPVDEASLEIEDVAEAIEIGS